MNALEMISTILVFFTSLLMIVLVAPFLSHVEFTSDLQANIIGSNKKYNAHATMAAIRSNEELREQFTLYSVDSNSPDSTIEPILEDQTSSYAFRFQEKEGGWNNLLELNSQNTESKRYSRIYIASPSENPHRIVAGVSGLN